MVGRPTNSNIIRPNFGSRSREAEPSDPADPGDEYQPLHVYGTAAGYIVALLDTARGPDGPTFKVVVGPADGYTIEAVAVMPVTDQGRVDADAAATAILRTLKVFEQT